MISQSSLRSFCFLTVLAFLTGCDSNGPAPTLSETEEPARSTPVPQIELVFTFGSEKENWLKEVTDSFNALGQTLPSGERIVVTPIPIGSGECIEEILNETRRPHLTSPASGAYFVLGNAKSLAATGKPIVNKTETLVLSPVVIAMWQPMAEAIGWGKKPVGWSDILTLAQDPRGWASLGHPEWGSFKFGHTHPESSNSGLISLIAEVYAGAGKTGDLTLEDVANPVVGDYLEGIEKAVVHYGSSTGFFGKKMFANGPGYLSAAVLYENMVVESYLPKHHLTFPLVAIYPKEGTFWSDHPVGIVERDWVTSAHREAAKIYIEYLLATAQQEKALPHGFRPADPAIAVSAPIDLAHGVDPSEPKTTLEVPTAPVMEAILDLWKDRKKHSNIVLTLDKSGSMNAENGERITNAKAGATKLVTALGDKDHLSLLLFSHETGWVFQDLSIGQNRERALAAVNGIFADGGTALYDAIAEAHRAISPVAAQRSDLISAIVVLTDGDDQHSKMRLEELLEIIRFDSENNKIRIFTIGYGSGANKEVLQKIADATQGKYYEGTPKNIQSVFRDIATFF